MGNITNAKDKVVGKSKEFIGKSTGNTSMEAKGRMQSLKSDFNHKVAKAWASIKGFLKRR